MSGRWFGCGWVEGGVVTPWRPGGMVRALLAEAGAAPALAGQINLQEQVLALGDDLAAHDGVTHWAISMRLMGKGDFLARLKAGKSSRLSTLRRALHRIAAIWPADLPWPADIPRPDPNEGDAR